jgi:peptide deformylase
METTQARPIIVYPHTLLKTPSTAVKDLPSARVQHIVDIMILTLKEKGRAAGLAAPQIGINEQIILCSFDRSIESLQTMINPDYQSVGEETELAWEMCFSVELAAANVRRYKRIKLDYQDLQGTAHSVELEGFAARVVQHECDHLKGVLCLEQGVELKKFKDLKEAQDFVVWVRAQHGH